MRRLEVRLETAGGPRVVGTLAEAERRVFFEYAPAFLADPLPISPLRLPARPGVHEHVDRHVGEVFGVFQDSLPDGWGRLLMDREFRRRGRDPRTLSGLDRLAYIGTRGMGALTYHPPADAETRDGLAVDLEELAREAERVREGDVEDVLPALRIAGGSPGGARPKVVVGVRDDGRMVTGAGTLPAGFRPFLIKFGAREDGPDIGAVEAAYARMAAAAGIALPRTRLFETAGGRYFGAERFDRAGDRRVHVHSLGGLLHADHRVPSLDYEGFLRATLALTRDGREVREAFRRMAFNVLAHNRDDHVRNHAFRMADDGTWTLAPAYDLVFSHGPGGEHTMAVAGEAARPTVGDLLRAGAAAGVEADAGRRIVEAVRDAVAAWPAHAAAFDVPAATARRIGVVLADRVRDVR